MSTICPSFSSRLFVSTFSSVPIAFHQCFTWIAQGDVVLCFSLVVVRKANAVTEENK
jgi:hypothetical protein